MVLLMAKSRITGIMEILAMLLAIAKVKNKRTVRIVSIVEN